MINGKELYRADGHMLWLSMSASDDVNNVRCPGIGWSPAIGTEEKSLLYNKNSVASTEGKFGFHVGAYCGKRKALYTIVRISTKTRC